MNPTVVIIVKTIIIFLIFFVIASIGEKIIKKMGKSDVNDPEKKYKKYDRIGIIYSQIASIFFYFILFISLLIIITLYGVKKETVYGIFIPISIAIGISAQGPLSNIWYGLIMILGELYEINDVIILKIQNMDQVIGRIISINLFYTKLVDLNDGKEIVVSNTMIYNSSVSYNQTVIYTEAKEEKEEKEEIIEDL